MEAAVKYCNSVSEFWGLGQEQQSKIVAAHLASIRNQDAYNYVDSLDKPKVVEAVDNNSGGKQQRRRRRR